jgi:hypothetical protein
MTKLDESKRASVRPSDLLAAAAAIATGTQAYGEVVIFINPPEGEPGHFDWALDSDSNLNSNSWLDITRPSTDQGGLVGQSSVGQLLHSGGSYFPYSFNYTFSGAAVISTTDTPYIPFMGTTVAVDLGDEINGGALFSRYSEHARFQFGADFSDFPLYMVKYMGVRFNDVDGYHYGWISVMAHGFFVREFRAFAWGYETEPGVPIIAGIPAPGTLAALAFGAVVTRRKRKDD